MSRFKTLLLGSSALLLGPASAIAQTSPPPAVQTGPASPVTAPPPAGPLYDPAQLPVYKGQVQLFTMTPRGDIDGLILTDGTEVKTPPHLSTQIAFAIKPGDAVTVHGLKTATLPLIQAASVTDDATGKTVVDNGPEGRGRGGPPPMPPVAGDQNGPMGGPGEAQAQGKVRMALHGPRGDVNGVLLDDGTILRMPPPEAVRFAALLRPGQTVVVDGLSRANQIGRMVEVTAIGPTLDQLMPVQEGRGGKHGRKGAPPPPPPGGAAQPFQP